MEKEEGDEYAQDLRSTSKKGSKGKREGEEKKKRHLNCFVRTGEGGGRENILFSGERKKQHNQEKGG